MIPTQLCHNSQQQQTAEPQQSPLPQESLFAAAMCVPTDCPTTSTAAASSGKRPSSLHVQEAASRNEEPSHKKVRFAADESATSRTTTGHSPFASAPNLQQHLPARRSRSAPPNLGASCRQRERQDVPDKDNEDIDEVTPSRDTKMAELPYKLHRLERIIHKAAQRELELMNQARALQAKRAKLTRKYQQWGRQLQLQQQRVGGGGCDNVFAPAPLPPLQPAQGVQPPQQHCPRRVSVDRDRHHNHHHLRHCQQQP